MILLILFYFSNSSYTLPVESSHNYERIALSPDGTLLFAVNEGIVNISFDFVKSVINNILVCIKLYVFSGRRTPNQFTKQ